MLFSEGPTRQYREDNAHELKKLGWTLTWDKCRSGKIHLVQKRHHWCLVYGVVCIEGSGYRALTKSFYTKELAMAYYSKISHVLTGPADTGANEI